jgi:hypothetical protein
MGTFKHLDESGVTPEDKSHFKEAIRDYPDEGVFAPYGMIKTPFKENVNAYIERAINERHEQERKTFRLGIEYAGGLIGCFVFDAIETNIQGYRTIGDIGMFWGDSADAKEYWMKAIYPVKYFINRILNYRKRSEGLFISVRTHPYNQQILPLLTPNYGFEEIERIYSYAAAGPRRMFIAPYSEFHRKFGSVDGEPKLKITNNFNGKSKVYADIR